MTTPDAIHAADERLQTILKAHVVGATVQDPASRPAGEDTASAFTSAGALIPPYDPETLCLLVEHSNSLRQNVDAYATNIDGNGYRFDAVIDFDAEDARSKVADAITLERLAAREARTLPEGMSTAPSAEEVSARFTELRQAARVERARLDAFFDFACFDHSFVDLRRRTRQDLEVTGNAFWEVLRDGKGDLARLVYVPSYTVRLLPLDREAVEVTERARVSPVSFDTVRSRRRMRRYVQVQSTECVYFKSFGDPRVISRSTGRVFGDIAALKAEIAGGRNPKDAKVMLAKEITTRFHSAAAADAAEQDFTNRSKGGVPDDIPEVALTGAPLGIGALLKQANLAPSGSEANRLIDGGGVRVDGNVVSDKGLKLDAGTYVVQVGKRKFARVQLG